MKMSKEEYMRHMLLMSPDVEEVRGKLVNRPTTPSCGMSWVWACLPRGMTRERSTLFPMD